MEPFVCSKDNVEERKIKIYRTDEMGEVVLKTNGKGLKFIPFIK